MAKIDKWEASKGITQRKKSWVVRSIPLVAAVFALSGVIMFAQPTPEPASAHTRCVNRTFRQRPGRDPYNCVPHIQKMLSNLMINGTLYSLSIDGYFGPMTDRAVRDFQRWERISVDGIVGPQTWGRFCRPQYSTFLNDWLRSQWLSAARAAGCNI
jgi:hypothetical protein